MSTATEHKTKKRKHAPAETVGEPSTKRSKTGKEKKTKHKDGKKKLHKKHDAGGQFKVVSSTLAISLPPVFANKPREGAEEMLDSLVMRYVPALQGVLLAHDNLLFLSSCATIKGDCPFANCTIQFNSTVWSPRVGMKLVGKVNLCSPDHVSLLVHRTFNVSIPRHHIPTDSWEFEYGPAENDPEFGGEAAGGLEVDGETSETVESSGRWVHKLTGEKLGGEEGNLEFTVIGLTVANQMLSLVGSIQHDPFSPEHVPDHSTITVPTRKHTTVVETPVPEDLDEQPGSEEEVDTFEALTRLNNEAEEVEELQRSKEQERDEARKEKKRKRKAEKAAAQGEGDEESGVQKKKKKKKDHSSS